MMSFKDIKQYTRDGHYCVDIGLDILVEHVERWTKAHSMDLNADFQRGHVWTINQQQDFVEFLLRGGRGSNIIRFNHPGWMKHDWRGGLVCVDGKQRLTACLAFMRGEIPAFGHYLKEYTDQLSWEVHLKFMVNDLKTRADMLRWYLDMNTGGTPHTPEEIEKVRQLLDDEKC